MPYHKGGVYNTTGVDDPGLGNAGYAFHDVNHNYMVWDRMTKKEVATIVGDETDLSGYNVQRLTQPGTISFAVFTQSADPQRAKKLAEWIGFDYYPFYGNIGQTLINLILLPKAYKKWRGIAQFVVIQAFRHEENPLHYHLPPYWGVWYQLLWARIFGFVPVFYEWRSGKDLIKRFL